MNSPSRIDSGCSAWPQEFVIDSDTLMKITIDVAQMEVDKRILPIRTQVRMQILLSSACFVAMLILGLMGHEWTFRVAGVLFFVIVGWMMPVLVKTNPAPVVITARFIPNPEWTDRIENQQSDLDS